MFWYLSIYNCPKLFNCIVRTRYVWKCENVCAGRAEHLMVRGKTFCYNDSSKRLRSTLWKAHQVVLTFQWEWKPTIMWVIDRLVGFFLSFTAVSISEVLPCLVAHPTPKIALHVHCKSSSSVFFVVKKCHILIIFADKIFVLQNIDGFTSVKN